MIKVEGLAHTFVQELQNMKHFIQEEETMIEEKLSEWKKHAMLFPKDLQDRITQIKEIMQEKLQNESDSFY